MQFLNGDVAFGVKKTLQRAKKDAEMLLRKLLRKMQFMKSSKSREVVVVVGLLSEGALQCRNYQL